MWFLTEVLPGLIAIVVIVVLVVQNVALRKLLQEYQRELAKKEVMCAALLLAEKSLLTQISMQSLAEPKGKGE